MFSDALDVILKFEGGYSNNPNDPGGATNFGITQNTYDPSLSKDVKYITGEEVSKIYQNQYWREGKCDAINTVSPDLALIHFDCCVNCGVGTAARLFQEILGTNIDGIIGPKTMMKVSDSANLKKAYLQRRKLYYDRLIEAKPRLTEFKDSWYHRLHILASKCGVSI